MSEVLHASALNLNSFVEFILNYYWFEIQNKIKTTRSQPQLVEASGGSTHNKTFQLNLATIQQYKMKRAI